MLAGFLAVGTDVGVANEVRLFKDPTLTGEYSTRVATTPATFSTFGSAFTGGVRVAMGDFDGDGNDELVTAAGPGGGPHVIVWNMNPDGSVGTMQYSFFAYGAAFKGGVFVAAGDIDGDGHDDLITGADAGGGSHVKIFATHGVAGQLTLEPSDQFFAFGRFKGGVRVAAGDVDGDGRAEVIVAAGPGGGPHVITYKDVNANGAVSDDGILESFFAYSLLFRGGVYVAAGPVDGTAGAPNSAEIITGPGSGTSQPVRIFSDQNMNGLVADEPLFDQFTAFGNSFTGGVRVAIGDTDHSAYSDRQGAGNEDRAPQVEVIAGAGPGGGPQVTIFDDNNDAGNLLSDNPADYSQFAYEANYTAGIFTAYGRILNQTFTNSTRLDIPDNGGTGSRINVPLAGAARGLIVAIKIDHQLDQDLQVELFHPVPPSHFPAESILFGHAGGNGSGFDVRFSDTFTDLISQATVAPGAVLTGDYKADGVFDDFNFFYRHTIQGPWDLSLSDQAAGNTGALISWSLIFSYDDGNVAQN